MKTSPIVKEVVITSTVSKVWKAITDKSEMKHWYFDLAEFRLEVGFEFQFEGGPDDRKYLHICKIIEVVPTKKLSYSWKYDGYEGISYVTFELFEEGKKTRLRLTHSGIETFPADNPDFARNNFNEGWTSIIEKSIKEYLEK
ncbi:MAG: SRPBCC domain-containing protein [Chlorobi bacterium]|nr:SRPBCC domain-containing protein [Chlorobiota bacterium]MCI0715443.1 SRPBCC domain-containing protein [Chlorobiota bacterium]